MLLGFIPAGALAENYKVCKASNPQEKTTYGRNDGVKILITECTEHIWRYTASETKGMHKVACGLCSMFSEEKHDFSLSGGARDNMRHYLKCACGEVSDTVYVHEIAYTPNRDTLTHHRACKVCGYTESDGGDEVHNFTANKALCTFCGFKRGASAEVNGTLTNCETLEEAIKIASEKDGIVTLYG